MQPGVFCLEKQIAIRASADAVFAFWADFHNFPKFIPLIHAVQVLDERHSRWIVRAPLGRTVEFDSKITEFSPGKRLCWETRHALGVSHGALDFRESNGMTRVACRFDYRLMPRWLQRLAEIMRQLGFPSHSFDEGLRRIKREIEGGQAGPTSMSV